MKERALSVEVPQIHIAVLLVEVAPEPVLVALLGGFNSLGTYCRRRGHLSFIPLTARRSLPSSEEERYIARTGCSIRDTSTVVC